MKKSFEEELRDEVRAANKTVRGTGTPPWEVVMEFLIRLERRVAKAEKERNDDN